MGHKVNPIGFRLGVYRNWDARWYADKDYTTLLHEDMAMRRLINGRLRNAGVARIETERSANQLTIIIQTAKPGIVIGKQGASVDALRDELERISGKKVKVTINEIKTPELDATLVAENVAGQLEKRMAFRRALKQTLMRSMRAGAKGVKIQVSGRLGGAEMSRREWDRDGRVPLHTLRANIDHGTAEARTTFGRIGVQVWLYKGDYVTATGDPIPAGGAVRSVPADTSSEPVEAITVAAERPAPAAGIAVADSPGEEEGAANGAVAVAEAEAPAEVEEEIDDSEVDEIITVVGPVADTGEKLEKVTPKRAPAKRKAPARKSTASGPKPAVDEE
jgi:small subunit ribosomal protein S3